MEGRLATIERRAVDARAPGRDPGRGIAVLALAFILATTAGWWALALYPVSETAPTWVMRTRAACFGSVGAGLPSSGGWVLLIGEPLGMIATLVTLWGDALRNDLRWLASRVWGRAVLVGCMGALVWGNVRAAQRVMGALGDASITSFQVSGTEPVARLDAPAPSLVLTDQHGERFELAAWRETPVIVTFAFAHCADVCPTLVQQLREARRQVARPSVPIVVVTLDPWRDVPARLPHIAAQWKMETGDRVLSGSVAEVNRVLDAWGVGRARDGATGDINHAAVAFLVTANGRLTARLDGGMDRMRDLLSAP